MLHCSKGTEMNFYPLGFEDDDRLRSAFIRDLTLQQLERSAASSSPALAQSASIPKTLIQYWHDPNDIPDDVRVCLSSWGHLREGGFEFKMFNDISASSYIADKYGARELAAFGRCHHPAMRSDYLRMCFVLAEGGLYVDADDVLLGDDWKYIFRSSDLKVQPLCYDVPSDSMVSAAEIWRADLPVYGRIFYVNNDPIAAPADHPILRRALARATEKLLGEHKLSEIQSTTGPGNFTAALAAHARELWAAGAPMDFELLHNWETIAETRWELSYRDDARNWRHVDFGLSQEVAAEPRE
jgi:mannosyltransferase OCH1-like enzyme